MKHLLSLFIVAFFAIAASAQNNAIATAHKHTSQQVLDGDASVRRLPVDQREEIRW